MIRAAALVLLCSAYAWSADEVVVDFENAVPLLADSKANRVPRWEEKGVVFTLAREPQQTKAKGMLMFFTNLSTGHKGILCAMATEPIPVRATFPTPVSSVSVLFWGSTGTPALLEAFDAEGKVVDRASLESVPARKSPGDPVPTFTMSVKASRIAYIQFSGPREGEYLAAVELRFTPISNDRKWGRLSNLPPIGNRREIFSTCPTLTTRRRSRLCETREPWDASPRTDISSVHPR